jgi:hypothetical protein
MFDFTGSENCIYTFNFLGQMEHVIVDLNRPRTADSTMLDMHMRVDIKTSLQKVLLPFCSLIVILSALFGILCISRLEFNHLLALLIYLVLGYMD